MFLMVAKKCSMGEKSSKKTATEKLTLACCSAPAVTGSEGGGWVWKGPQTGGTQQGRLGLGSLE